ncbi:hypothetical protein [Salipiger bermudensis]|uniref:hypothetical protein n=1 Tax=Salipiger bermudensis TaxID=344736 RepID=UPI001A8CF46C|nr:hypothetical protein [Salipiger bermudensis]MBN9678815.1 hypothetical protein [Salipiger bermudensis]
MPRSFTIPIEINQKRVDDEAGFRDLSLRYTLKDAPAGQPVRRGRLIAEPVIDLNDYSFEAGIDWIAVQVSLVSWTSWRELRTIIKPAVQCAGKGGVFVFGPKWEEN